MRRQPIGRAHLVTTAPPAVWHRQRSPIVVEEPSEPAPGFTVRTPLTTSRIIYVSDTDGDDATAAGARTYGNYIDGSAGAPLFGPGWDPRLPPSELASDLKPYKTITAAYAELRTGNADWMILKRGDTFQRSSTLTITKSGQDATNPQVWAAYGTGARPIWQMTASANAIHATQGSGIPANAYSFIDITDLHVTGNTTFGSNTFFWQAGGTDLLVENCLFENMGRVSLSPGTADDPNNSFNRFTFRRNISQFHREQGLYMGRTFNAVIEENIFHHNGWNANKGETIFDHNLYLWVSPLTTPATFRRNISSYASSHGLEQRCGGLCQDNLFITNAIHFSFCLDIGGSPPPVGGASGTAELNVCIGNKDTAANPRGAAIQIGRVNLDGCILQDNIVAHFPDPNGNDKFLALDPGNLDWEGLENFTCRRNKMYKASQAIEIDAGTRFNILPIVIQDNRWWDDHTNQVYFYRFFSDTVSNFSFLGNKYWNPNVTTGTNKFRVTTTEEDWAAWVTRSGDNGTYAAFSFVDPTRQVSTYNSVVLGRAEDQDDFISQAIAKLDRYTYDTAYQADVVNAWIRAGYEDA